MSGPAVKDLNLTFSQTDNLPIGLHENPHGLYETSNLSHNFNIDLNKTFDLNKYDEHIKAPGEIKVLEPLNKYTIDCTIQKKDVPGKVSQTESLDRLESDDSLGIIPDLLKDEMTFDLFKSEPPPDDEIHDDFNSEINDNPVSLVFSPPSDNQFNRISLFLKNISTPLPNFGNDRRCSSTPKVSITNHCVADTLDIEHYSSPDFLPDEKEEPIAGSCHIKFETEFNLDDLKNMKPLTSTHKTFSPPLLSPILNKLDEVNDLKSEVNFKKNHASIENNLNVTQTFSHNAEDLFPCVNEDNIQNVNILNNTFQIKQPVFVESIDAAVVSHKCSIPSTMRITQAGSNNCSEKEKVMTLDSTFAIPKNEISFTVDCEKTFLIDVNSAKDSEVSPKSFYKDKVMNETRVLEMDSMEFSLKQQEQTANVTFTKDLENDAHTSLERCYSSNGTVFKPMVQILEETFLKNDLKPILEETFSENDLNKMLDHSKNILQYVDSKNQSASETGNIKGNVTFSEKIEIISGMKVTQNSNLIEFSSYDSPQRLASNIFHEAENKNCFYDQTENENGSLNKLSFSVALKSSNDATFSLETDEREEQEIEKVHKSDSNENNSIGEFVSSKSPKACANTTFIEEARGKICILDQINLTKNENLSNKMFTVALQSVGDAIFSEKTNEIVDQENDNLHKSNASENVNRIIELVSPKYTKALASDTFNGEVEGKISFHDHIETVYDPTDKMSHSKLLQSISDTVFSETNEKCDVVNGKFYKKNLIHNESSTEITSYLPKINKSLTFSDGSEETNFLESSVFQDSDNLIEKSDTNLQTIFSTKAAESLKLNQCDNCQARTSFPKAIEDNSFTGNTLEETGVCPNSISERDCPFEILPVSSNLYGNTKFSGNTDQAQSNIDSNEIYKVSLAINSLKEMTDITFSEKVCEVKNEQIFITTENDEFESALSSQNETTNAPFPRLADKDSKVEPVAQIIQCDQDSLGETTSSSLTKVCLKDAIFRKASDKLNSLKSCSLKSKTVVKNGLLKPSKIVFPRKVSEQQNGQLSIAKPLCKPIIDKRSSTSGLNGTSNLCDNSTDKSCSKTFNRRLTVSCSSESDNNKHKNDLKKSFGIPSKLCIKKTDSNVQKSRLDTKYSNEHLKDVNALNEKQNLLPQPELISSKYPNVVESVTVASVNAKGPVSSRLGLHGKLPLKSLKMRECGLKSDTALIYNAEKCNNKVISCPKVTDQPREEKVLKIGINNSNSGKSYSRHSIATNLPRKFLSFNNIPNKTGNSKPTAIKQKSAPASNSCKTESLKPEGIMKLPNSIVKLKFSSLPKVQSSIKISVDGSKSKSVVSKPVSQNKKPNGFLLKPCIPKIEAVQLVETQSTGHVKQKDAARENNQPTTSMLPPSREQTGDPSKPLKVKKSNGQCNFLPMPKMIMKSNIASVNSNDVPIQGSQIQVCQQTSGKLPQLRRIPAPRFNK